MEESGLEPEEEAEVPEIITLSCRMRSKVLTWTLMAKTAANRQKKDLLEEKEKHLAKAVRRVKV